MRTLKKREMLSFARVPVLNRDRRALAGVSRSLGVILPLVILWVFLAFAAPEFLTLRNINNLLLQGSVIGIMAFGFTVALIAEEIDLSIGAVQGFAAVVAALLMVNEGLPLVPSLLAVVAVGLAIGFLNGVMTTVLAVPSFITTLAMLGVITGVGLVLTDGQSVYGFPENYLWMGQGKVLVVAAPVVVALVVLAVVHFILSRTRLGLHFYATGGDTHAAAEVGIRTRRVKTLALTISAGAAAVSGLVVSARLDAAHAQFGANDLLNAIAAVVIGGTALTGGRGSVIDTALGVLVIATMNNGLVLLGVTPFWTQAAVGAIILVVAILDRRTRVRRFR